MTSLLVARVGVRETTFLRKEADRRTRGLGLRALALERQKTVGAKHTARFWASICTKRYNEGEGGDWNRERKKQVDSRISHECVPGYKDPITPQRKESMAHMYSCAPFNTGFYRGNRSPAALVCAHHVHKCTLGGGGIDSNPISASRAGGNMMSSVYVPNRADTTSLHVYTPALHC